MTGRALIAHGGPQRYPTRAAPSLMRALRDARGSPPWTPWTILCRLTGTTGLMQPLLVSTVQIAATLSPTPSAASRVITITGIRDHLQPEWLITITGIRSFARNRKFADSSLEETVSSEPVSLGQFPGSSRRELASARGVFFLYQKKGPGVKKETWSRRIINDFNSL
jgi:hypothetical protein